MKELVGQTVVITGAGAGIGRALAKGFVRAGAHVVAISRSAAHLEETRISCHGSGDIECHAVDVTDALTLESVFADVVARRKGIDVLINCAAVYPRWNLVDGCPADWLAGVATNLNGVAFGCRAALRTFPAGRPAIILNVGSFAHLGPEPASTLYCATKAAVSAFTRALAVELAAAGSSLMVHEWIPGTYRTQMSQFLGDDPRLEDPGLAFERLVSVMMLARQGRGGRQFAGGEELNPPRSLKTRIKGRIKGWLTGRRG